MFLFSRSLIMNFFKRNVFFTVSLVGILTVCGCFSGNPEDITAFVRPHEKIVTMDEYTLEPPDQITIISSKVDQIPSSGSLPGLTQTINPDGTISLEDIGRVQVAGKTPREVAELLAQRFSSLYRFDSAYPIDVQVNNQSKFYYVVGQVSRPGAQLFDGRETTLSAICKAIPTTLAWEEEIQIIRPATSSDQPSRVFGLNFKRMAEHGDMSQNVLLQEGDVIYVPPTILASIGLTLEEIVGPVLSGSSAASAVNGL